MEKGRNTGTRVAASVSHSLDFADKGSLGNEMDPGKKFIPCYN
jgi:hypothetical protein